MGSSPTSDRGPRPQRGARRERRITSSGCTPPPVLVRHFRRPGPGLLQKQTRRRRPHGRRRLPRGRQRHGGGRRELDVVVTHQRQIAGAETLVANRDCSPPGASRSLAQNTAVGRSESPSSRAPASRPAVTVSRPVGSSPSASGPGLGRRGERSRTAVPDLVEAGRPARGRDGAAPGVQQLPYGRGPARQCSTGRARRARSTPRHRQLGRGLRAPRRGRVPPRRPRPPPRSPHRRFPGEGVGHGPARGAVPGDRHPVRPVQHAPPTRGCPRHTSTRLREATVAGPGPGGVLAHGRAGHRAHQRLRHPARRPAHRRLEPCPGRPAGRLGIGLGAFAPLRHPPPATPPVRRCPWSRNRPGCPAPYR